MTDDVFGLIEQKAQQYGEDADTAKKIAQIESGGRNIQNTAGGSAAGVFQFMPKTAAQYGLTNPYDVEQNVDAGIRLLRDNRAALKSSLGRDPTPGELYLAHQQGAGGAKDLLTNPDLAAASVVGSRAVLANGGGLDMTAGQFANKWTSKLDGPGGSAPFQPRQVKYADLWAPPPVDPFKGTEDDRMKYREGLLGEFDAFQDAYSANTITGMAWHNAQMPDALKPDASFAPTANDIKTYATNAKGESLPPEYLSRFHDALSDGQAKWIADQAWEDVTRRKRLASLGWANNLGLNTAATLLDPATWAVAGATSGALNPATSILAQYGRLGMVGARALEGGVSNVAITAALQHGGVPTSDADYLSAMALGMGLGGAFGVLGKAPHTGVADGVARAGTELSDHARYVAADAEGVPLKRPSSQAHDVEHSPSDDYDTLPAAPGGHDTAHYGLATAHDVLTNFDNVMRGGSIDAERFSFPPTGDELDQILARGKAHQDSEVDRLFGDDAANVKKWMRSSTDRAYDSLDTLIHDKYGYESEQNHFVYGTKGHSIFNEDSIKGLHKHILDIEGAVHDAARGDPEMLARELAWAAPKLPDPAANIAAHTEQQRVALLSVSRAFSAMADAGVDIGPVLRRAVEYTGERVHGDASDAHVLLDRLASYAKGIVSSEAPAARHGTPLLEAPTTSTVGAQQVQFPVHPLDLNTGDLGTVREKGQFTSNIRTGNASVSHFLTPASGTQLASSPFATTRMIAAHLAGNPLGYKNAKNPLDAAMQGLLMRNRANGVLDRFLKPAFREWASDQGYSRVQSLTKKPEFMREVYNYITAKGDVEAHPAVARYANQAVKPLLKEWTQRINDAGLAEHLPYDTNYLPRIYDPGKVGDAYRTHGVENLKHLVKASMADMEWTKALTPEQLDRVAKGYAEGVSKKALDLHEDWNHSWSGDNLDHLRSILVSDAGMGADEAKGITDAVARLTEKDRGANGRLKNRVDLDINAQHPATGDLKLSDMLVKDVSYLMERYNDQMSGRIALAKTKIVDPDTGDVVVNGLKSDADFDNMIREWKRTTEEQYLSKASSEAERKNLLNWRKLDEANMRFQYNRILSRGTEADNQLFGRNTQSGQIMRLMRKFSFDRMMGATGWSHMSIFGAMLSGIGFRAALEHIPAFRHIVSMDGETIRAHGLDRELESIFGNHTDPLRGLQMHDWEHDWGATPLHQRNGILGTADHVLSQTNKITAVASGLAHIIDLNTRWAQKGIAQKFANMAYKAKELPGGGFDLSGVNMRRMMQLGLDEGDMQKVLGQVKQHATTEDGILFSHKLTKLNLDKWDQETAHAFQGALQRNVDRIVQHNDVGSLHRWASSPLWQLMMQFRNFPMVGQTKQLMFNIAMHDAEAANYFLTTSALGALIYIAREKVNSIGREDRDAYLEKRLSMHNIAHAALYHSGYAGMMPSMIDTGMRLSGGDPLFDFRTTGNSSALWGAPAVTNVDDFMKGAEAIRRPIAEDRTRSQAEARTLIRMFPWSNTLPMTLLGNVMVRNLPEHTPPKPRH